MDALCVPQSASGCASLEGLWNVGVYEGFPMRGNGSPPIKNKLQKEDMAAMLAFYMQNPGDVAGCARACGLDPRTTRRGWFGPPWSHIGYRTYAPKEPMRDIVERERTKAEKERTRLETTMKAELRERADRARTATEEAERIDENTLRLARNNVMVGLGHLARLNEGIAKLAERVGAQLARGVDAKGDPVDISPLVTLRIIGGYTKAVHSMVSAVDVLVGVTRVRSNMIGPAQAIIDVAGATLEDAERELMLAQEAVSNARKMGLAARPDFDKPGQPVTWEVPEECMPPAEFMVKH